MHRKELKWNDTIFFVDIIPFLSANIEQVYKYRLEDGQFLIHLFDGRTYTSFPVFIDDNMEWNTHSSELMDLDRNLIEKIGFLIDDIYA